MCPSMLPARSKARQHCCAPCVHMFLKIFGNIFSCPGHKVCVSATNVARVARRVNLWETCSRQQCCRNVVSSFCRPLRQHNATSNPFPEISQEALYFQRVALFIFAPIPFPLEPQSRACVVVSFTIGCVCLSAANRLEKAHWKSDRTRLPRARQRHLQPVRVLGLRVRQHDMTTRIVQSVVQCILYVDRISAVRIVLGRPRAEAVSGKRQSLPSEGRARNAFEPTPCEAVVNMAPRPCHAHKAALEIPWKPSGSVVRTIARTNVRSPREVRCGKYAGRECGVHRNGWLKSSCHLSWTGLPVPEGGSNAKPRCWGTGPTSGYQQACGLPDVDRLVESRMW